MTVQLKDKRGTSLWKSIFSTFASATALLSFAIQTGCLPTTNMAPLSSASNANSTASSSGDSSSGSTDSGIPNLCYGFDAALPERAYCVSCYNQIASTRCNPGETLETCSDATVAQSASNLVNLCVSQSVIAGFVCSTSCPTGTSLNIPTCSCVASNGSSSGGSSGGTSSGPLPVDTGQTDYGPPVVRAIWPGSYITKTHGDSTTPCTSDAPVYFDVKNRGSSIPRLNVYNVAGQWPTGTFSNTIKGVTTPALVTNSNLVKSTLSVESGATGSPGVFGDFVFFDDFEIRGPHDNFTLNGGALVDTNFSFGPTFSRFLGGKFTGSDYVTLSIPNLPSGTYLLTFDLYLVDDWQGAQPSPTPTTNPSPVPNQFVVQTTTPTASTIFNQSLSSNNDYGQSYTGIATFKGSPIGFPSYPDSLPDAAYPIAARLNVQCAVSPCTLTVTFQGQGLQDPARLRQLWGVDNVGLKPLREFAVKYTFTDTNQLTSAYCMWFEQYLACSNPGNGTGGSAARETCSCWLGPRSSDSTGESFSGVRPDPSTTCPVSDFAGALPAPTLSVDTTSTWYYTGVHNNSDCVAAGGAAAPGYSVENLPLCKLPPKDAAGTCKDGWTQWKTNANFYSELDAVSLTWYDDNLCNGPHTCTIPAVAWAAGNALTTNQACTAHGFLPDGFGTCTNEQWAITLNNAYTRVGCY